MKIRGLIMGFLGLVCLLFPELLTSILGKDREDKAVLLRLNRIMGMVLVLIGIFLVVVDN